MQLPTSASSLSIASAAACTKLKQTPCAAEKLPAVKGENPFPNRSWSAGHEQGENRRHRGLPCEC